MDETFSKIGMKINLGEDVRAEFSLPVTSTPDNMVRPHQVHGNVGVRVTEKFKEGAKPEADWIWTSEKHLRIAIAVADCSAILLHGENGEGKFTAAIHAGWRGTAKGIIEKAVEELKPRGEFVTWMSPSICQDHYEVGEEVIDELCKDRAGIRNFIRASKPGKFFLDLKNFQKEKLQYMGAKVLSSSLCNYCQNEFYSYRQSSQQYSGERIKRRHLASIELI